MGRQTKIALPHRRALNKTLLFTKHAPAAAGQPPHVYVRAVRAALRMTQESLARRAGVAKSHVALIESGAANVGVETLRRIFDAMFCDLLIVPKARKKPTQALAERELERVKEPRYYEKRGPWD
jgi:transcriptional regulator with XRE-family HTH domain